ncbi:MAG: hypothetical protein H6577_21145 [Lewinellaceae bacterium]|nr:hypothetical protein [Saprospiraceae bacterium]MCB9340637.1 hypothetical protein [Lewinellaceae bacterium]
MKAIHFFNTGAAIDIIALLAAVWMMVSDSLKGYSGTNNPTMFMVTFIGALIVGGAFLLKSAGYLKIATALLWIPGTPLLLYGFFILLFIILKPDMR